MHNPSAEPIGIRLIHPGKKNLQQFARKRELSPSSAVNIMLPAGSNSQFAAPLAGAMLRALHNECHEAAMRIIARVDVLQTPYAQNVRPNDTAALDVLIADMNDAPDAHAPDTLKAFPWLQQLESHCAALGRSMVLLVQQQSNSLVEAQSAVRPPQSERTIIAEPTHVIQLAHVLSLAERQRLGMQRALLQRGALDLAPKNVVVATYNRVRPPANLMVEHPMETASWLAAALEEFGVPLDALRKALRDLKGWASPIRHS